MTKELNAKAIRKYRIAKGMTVIELANKLNVSRTIIYSYESGAKVPSPKTLTKIAEVLAVEPLKLLGA